jgi:phosphopantetheinyl transferase
MTLILNRYETNYRLSLWKLTESLEILEERSRLNQYDNILYQQISNETRKREWLAVRIMLNEVLGFWPQITYMETGKPILNNHSRHLSISHSKEMVGILLSTSPFAGVDIENRNRNIEKVKNRFLSKTELENIETMTVPDKDVLHWCAKEAIFKSVNMPNIDFASRIIVDYISSDGTIQGKFISGKDEYKMNLSYLVIEGHVVVWTV